MTTNTATTVYTDTLREIAELKAEIATRKGGATLRRWQLVEKRAYDAWHYALSHGEPEDIRLALYVEYERAGDRRSNYGPGIPREGSN